jgi:hypothetical protein
MRNRLPILVVPGLIVLLALVAGVTQAQGPEGTGVQPAAVLSLIDSFTYQGRLFENGQPANGNYDFRIGIWDAETLGSKVSSAQALAGQPVQHGLFALRVVPGDPMDQVFDGGRRWIEVEVKASGTMTYTALPRQPIAAVPYAWGLRPGADVVGSVDQAVLSLVNEGTTGTSSSALRATGSSPSAPAVAGHAAGGGVGVYGSSTITGTGVRGYVDSSDWWHGIGVAGFKSGYDVSDLGGYWTPGGLFGGHNGVMGVTKNSSGYGVLGWAKSSPGLSYGVVGVNDSPNGYGVKGINNSSSGWAAQFVSEGNGVQISTPPTGTTGLSVIGGAKNAVVRTDDGSRLLYAEESSEVWFSDYGFGQLKDGQVAIDIDPIFAQTVNLQEPYHVFIQPYGNAALYVNNRTPQGFEVHAREGDPNVEFSYRVVAKRLGFEEDRLERAPWADSDPNLYPEKRGQMEAMGQGVGQPRGQP